MKSLKFAAILLLIHGLLMEFSIFVAFIVFMIIGLDMSKSGEYFSFALPYLQDNLPQMMIMSGIFGAVRVIGAIGLLKNRMWGLTLSVINCVVTMVLMIFMLPAGIPDGILACTALVLILTGYYGKREIMTSSSGPYDIVGRPDIDLSQYTVTVNGREVIDYEKLKNDDYVLYQKLLENEKEDNSDLERVHKLSEL